jgi:uncharacterized membrane protein
MYSKRFRRKLNRIRQKGERYKKEQAVRDIYAQYWPDRKKRRISNIMLVIVVAAIIVYTVASFWIQYKTGVPVDATLTTCFYTFWGSELIALTGIKISKVFKTETSDEACG